MASSVIIMKDWFDELERSEVSSEKIDKIFGVILRAMFYEEDPDMTGLDMGERIAVNSYLGQIQKMKSKTEMKIQTASNRAGKSKYNADYIYALRRIGLTAKQIKDVLGYPNESAAKDSKGWISKGNIKEEYECRLDQIWKDMNKDISDLVEKLVELKVEKVEIEHFLEEKVEVESGTTVEKVEMGFNF